MVDDGIEKAGVVDTCVFHRTFILIERTRLLIVYLLLLLFM